MEKYISIFKIVIAVVLFFTSSIETKSQDYKKIHKIYTNVYLADSLYEIKDYQHAIKFYQKAKDGYYYQAMMLSQIARCYLALGDSSKAREQIRKIPSEKSKENTMNEELRAEFLKRKVTDQMYRGPLYSGNDSLWKIQKEYDRENQLFLDSIIDKYGWPGNSLIGEDGARTAFLFAQHADEDLKFQEKCLKFMKKALAKDDVFRPDFAYLVDRIMLKKIGSQLFGSQCMVVDGIFQPRPLYDTKRVNTLRKYFTGTVTLEEYLKFMQDRYDKSKQDEK